MKKMAIVGIICLLIPLSASYSTSGSYWTKDTVLYKFDNSVPSSYHQSMKKGANAWDSDSTSFTFKKKAWYQTTDNTLNMDSSVDAVAVTTTWVYTGTNELSRFQIDFNNDKSWSTSGESNSYDVWNIAAHEFGHALGLSHSDNTDATMHSETTQGETEKRTLSQGV